MLGLGTVHILTNTGTWNLVPVPNCTVFRYFTLSVITKNIISVVKNKYSKSLSRGEPTNRSLDGAGHNKKVDVLQHTSEMLNSLLRMMVIDYWHVSNQH